MKVISVEQTPNPHAIKFVLDGRILESGSKQFDAAPEKGCDAVADELFRVASIKSVYYRDNFITIENKDPLEWNRIRTVLDNLLEKLSPVESKSAEAKGDGGELLLKIELLLDQRVRPFLANDGGGLEVVKLEGKNLMIHYEGACGSCPHAVSGTLHSIQNLLRSELDSELNVIPA